MNKEDLHKIAPKLSEISLKKTDFEIPKNYFETVEDAVIAELKAEKLQQKKAKNPFKTPENYFNSLEDIVLTRLKAEAIQNNKINEEISDTYFTNVEDAVFNKMKSTSKVISLKSKIIKYVAPISIAASLLLIFTLNTNSNKVTFDSLASSEIENWINNNNIDIDALSIAAMYPEIELTTEIDSESLSDDEVANYLTDEDLESIIFEN